MASDPSTATRRPWFRRLGVVVPLVALGGWFLGFAVHRLRPSEERPLEVTAAPGPPLAPIALPPRNRVLQGTLVGHDDRPIDGALVSLVAGDEPHWTTTRTDGSFRLEGLQRGPWTVTFAATQHLPFSTTLPDDDAAARVKLPDAPRVLPTLPPPVLVDVTGRVRAPEERSFAGFEVYLTPVAPLDELDAPLPRRARCDASGAFALPSLRAGEYRVTTLPEWAQDGTWPDLARALDAPTTTWNVRGDGPRDFEIVLAAGGVRGRVADRAGAPIEGALVLVASEADESRVWPPATAGPDGTFVVTDLPPGRYVVRVRAGSGSHRSVVEVPARTVVDVALPPLAVEQNPGRS